MGACGSSPSSDAGPDAGFSDASIDAAVDATVPDAARDAGPSDTSVDSGPDAAPDTGIDAGPAIDAGPRLRIMAANLTSGNFQSYDPGEGIRIMKALQPDIVLIQEFNIGNDSQAELQNLSDEVIGAPSSYYRGAFGKIPNGILSRYPILEAGTWDDPEVGNRGFTWARIDIPGDIDLWSVSLHLLTANAGTRNREAIQLVSEIQTNVPDEDFLVVGGDLNTDRRDEIALTTLSAVISVARVPVDQDGNDGTNKPRSKPYDWVLPDDDLEALHRPVTFGTQSFAEGLVFDSRVFTPLSDVPPVMLEDSDASQMQHMAVVRDFDLP